ncbi:hypothetical protein [uncultured Salinicola sp.]|uniref:hypothetical protein n=1 Tax=uncultured Salinicola sp. TaxID=1193542 RepID=UPI00262C4627|nr:hypothetical protein [uncultured Salinicola sp.]|tara:strand:+ start:478 stop:828 length:351 start_codon:yes stop_codon:yes gene_type:complete
MNIRSIIAAPLVLLALGSIVACGDGSSATAGRGYEDDRVGNLRVTCVSEGEVVFDDYGTIKGSVWSYTEFYFTSLTTNTRISMNADCFVEENVDVPAEWTPVIPGRTFDDPSATTE